MIPVRDRGDMLVRCLDSVGIQAYRPMQVIVVDNASADDSMQLAMQWKETGMASGIEVIVASEPRQGATFARNKAMEYADGDVVAFVDSDDTLRPEYASALMAPFNADGDTEIAFWRKMGHWPDGATREFKFTRHASLENHVVHAVLDTMGCAVSRKLFIRSGGWNTALPIWNDWEIGIRYLLNRQGSVARINRVLVDKYQHADSITGNSYLSRKGRYEKALDAARKVADGNPRLIMLLAYKATVLAAHYSREGNISAGRETLSKALTEISSMCGKGVLKLVYRYSCTGARGAAIWALPLLNIIC